MLGTFAWLFMLICGVWFECEFCCDVLRICREVDAVAKSSSAAVSGNKEEGAVLSE